MKDVNMHSIHFLLLLQGGLVKSLTCPNLAIMLQVNCGLSAPVRREDSTADKTSNSSLKDIKGQVKTQAVRVSVSVTS